MLIVAEYLPNVVTFEIVLEKSELVSMILLHWLFFW